MNNISLRHYVSIILLPFLIVIFISGESKREGGNYQCNSFINHNDYSKYDNLSNDVQKSYDDVLENKKYLQCLHYSEREFYLSLESEEKITILGNIKGGIVPHHQTAFSMMIKAFKIMAVTHPEIVYIIGPNHQRIGSSGIHTGRWNWNTPFGVTEIYKQGVEAFIEALGAKESFEILQNEHSVSILVPYIKYFMPNAIIVPILLHGNLSLQECYKIAGLIEKTALNKKVLVIGSIDFSHYLPPKKAEKMDIITQQAVYERKYNEIIKMGNDNLDSPSTLITVMKTMEKLNALNTQILDNSNSSIITGKYSDETTSYFTIVFSKTDN